MPHGAATGTVGGAGGQAVRVVSLADSGPGTLRDAVSAPGRIVTFAVSGTILLRFPVLIASFVTVDGRGSDITISGRGLRVAGEHDIVIRNLKLIHGAGDSSDDAISVYGASRRVWIHHNELSDYPDGLIDVTQESTNVTISWNLLRDHGKGMLLGAGSVPGTPAMVDMTIDHNRFLRVGERQPKMRHGRFHVYDNVVDAYGYSPTSGSAVAAGCGSIVLVESTSLFPVSKLAAVQSGLEVGCDPSRTPALRVHDVYGGGATVGSRQPDLVPAPENWPDRERVEPRSLVQVSAVREGAGAPCRGAEHASAAITIDPSTLRASYDGLAHVAMATTDPPDVAVSLQYADANGQIVNGGPVDAGSYLIRTGRCSEARIGAAESPVLVIEPVPLVVRAVDTTRAFGGANHFAAETTGQSPLDQIEVSFATTATRSSNVGSYPIEPSLTDALDLSNYIPTLEPGTLTVVPTPLVVTATSASRRLGEPNGPFGATIEGLIDGDAVDAGATTVADESSPPGEYSIDPYVVDDPVELANYEIRLVPGTLSVLPAPSPATLVVDPASIRTTYDGQAHPISVVTEPLHLPVETTYTDATGADVAAPVRAGAYTAVSRVTSPDFVAEPLVSEVVIDPAPLTVRANAATMTYGAPLPDLAGTVAGLFGGDIVQASLTTSATPASPVGEYPIVAALVDPSGVLTNYRVTVENAAIRVVPAPLIVRADPASMAFGSHVPTLTGTVTGLVASERLDVSYTTTADEFSPIGAYPIVPVVGDATGVLGNYAMTVENSTIQVLSVAVQLTVDPSSLRSVYNGRPHPPSVHVEPSVVEVHTSYIDASGVPLLVPVDAGTYTAFSWIVSEGFSGFSGEPVVSEVVIEPAPLLVRAGSASTTYGSPIPPLTGALIGLIADDGISATYSTPVTSKIGVGSYPIEPGLADPRRRLSNYRVTFEAGVLTVHPAVLSIVAPSASRPYGSTTALAPPTYLGLVNGETPSSLAGALLCSTTATPASPVGTYPIVCSGSTSSSYAIAYVNGVLTVRPATLVITANDATRLAGAANPTFTARFNGFVNGQGPSVLSGTLRCVTTATTSSAAGKYAIGCSGLSSPMYATQYVAGVLTVTAPPVTSPWVLLTSGGKRVAVITWTKVPSATGYLWELSTCTGKLVASWTASSTVTSVRKTVATAGCYTARVRAKVNGTYQAWGQSAQVTLT